MTTTALGQEKLYVLECSNGKYYVGKTSRPVTSRFLEHCSKNPSAWTRLYPPKDIVFIKPKDDEDEETRLTKQWMKKHGIQNVRGGAFSTVDLTDEEMRMLQREFAADADLCYNCLCPGHFVNACPDRNSKAQVATAKPQQQQQQQQRQLEPQS
jgi:predicted GIY-YIG superfamily endonuclease